MHDHFEEGDGGDADGFEVVGIGAPGMVVILGLLVGGIVAVEGVAVEIDEFDGVFEL